MTRTQVYFPHSQLEYLRQRAREENTSMSEVLRRIVADCGQKKPKKKMTTSELLLSLAREAEERGIKGPKDLSSKVDEYLYGGK